MTSILRSPEKCQIERRGFPQPLWICRKIRIAQFSWSLNGAFPHRARVRQTHPPRRLCRERSSRNDAEYILGGEEGLC
jgi:hypothetical protein